MQTILADLKRALYRLDELGRGGSAVGIHVAAAVAAAEEPGDRHDLATFAALEATLWPSPQPLDFVHAAGRAGREETLDRAA